MIAACARSKRASGSPSKVANLPALEPRKIPVFGRFQRLTGQYAIPIMHSLEFGPPQGGTLCSAKGPACRGSFDAGWSSLVARRAHNPKVVGSNPAPATNNTSPAPILATCKRKSPLIGAFSYLEKIGSRGKQGSADPADAGAHRRGHGFRVVGH